MDTNALSEFGKHLTQQAFGELQVGFDELVQHLRGLDDLRAIAQQSGPAAVLQAETPAIAALQKKNKEFVTGAEVRAEDVMRKLVQSEFPTHSLVGEELGASDGDDWLWVFDPVDGTSAMIRTAVAVAFNVPLETPQPRFGISIGVVNGEDAVAGVIAELEAIDGQLALTRTWTSADATPVPAAPPLDQAALACTIPEVMFTTFESWSGFQALLDSTGSLVTDQNCIGFMHLLTGETHVACEADLTLPDSAALIPILLTAGFAVTDHNGEPCRFDVNAREGEYRILAAAPDLHAVALKRLKDGVADSDNRFADRHDNHGYAQKFPQSGVSRG